MRLHVLLDVSKCWSSNALPAHYRNGKPHSHSNKYCQWNAYHIGVFGYIDHKTPNCVRTLTEVWDNGFEVSRNKRFLGHRPIISTQPLKYGPYVWETYAEVDVRRRNIGSALCHMFGKGELGGGELETVGIWSQNRPGNFTSLFATD